MFFIKNREKQEKVSDDSIGTPVPQGEPWINLIYEYVIPYI